MRAILSAVAGSAFVALASVVHPEPGRTGRSLLQASMSGCSISICPASCRSSRGATMAVATISRLRATTTPIFASAASWAWGSPRCFGPRPRVFFDIDTASGSEQQEQAISASISGDVRTYGVMLNSWVDLGAGTTWGIYGGGGAGMLFADTSHRIVDRAQNALQGSGDGTDTEFAYQLGRGRPLPGLACRLPLPQDRRPQRLRRYDPARSVAGPAHVVRRPAPN